MIPAVFLSRPNRFIAKVLLEGREETVHVKNTGRCRELLIPGVTVYLACAENPTRKTAYDLVAVEKKRPNGETVLINMDSQLPNAIAAEYLTVSGLFSADAVIRREVTHGDSRFDLWVEDNGKTTFVEVKGVTLEQDGCAFFPDAPTERGTRHLRELAEAKKQGLLAFVVFVVKMENIRSLSPNDEQDPAFGAALRKAAESGVIIHAVGCRVTPERIEAATPIPVEL